MLRLWKRSIFLIYDLNYNDYWLICFFENFKYVSILRIKHIRVSDTLEIVKAGRFERASQPDRQLYSPSANVYQMYCRVQCYQIVYVTRVNGMPKERFDRCAINSTSGYFNGYYEWKREYILTKTALDYSKYEIKFFLKRRDKIRLKSRQIAMPLTRDKRITRVRPIDSSIFT